ncbi:hypothetical protein DSECCO2_658590 [anaerobic digester metagenome]
MPERLDAGLVVPEVLDEGGIAVDLRDPPHEILCFVTVELPEVKDPEEVVKRFLMVEDPGKERRRRGNDREVISPLEYRPQRPDLAPLHLGKDLVDVLDEDYDLPLPGRCGDPLDRGLADH